MYHNLSLSILMPLLSWKVMTGGLLYLGPETIMPLASMIAAAIGILLIFWRFLFDKAKKAYKFIIHKITGKPIAEPVYVDAGDETQDEMDSL